MPYQQNRNRVIGTIEERIALCELSRYVIEAMKNSGHFQGIDLESLSTTVIGFLREPALTSSEFVPIQSTEREPDSRGKHLENLGQTKPCS